MEKQVRMQAARWLAEQEMMPQALLQPGDTPSESELAALAEYGCGVLSGSGHIVAACAGLDPRAVFLSADAPEDALRAAHGRCRYLAQTPGELQKLDALAGPLLPEGYCEDIAIRVWPRGGGEHPRVRPAHPPDGQSGGAGAVSALRSGGRPVPADQGRLQPGKKDPFGPALYAPRLLL